MAVPTIRDRAAIDRRFGLVPAVLANDGGLSQVCLNLLVNAAQSFVGGGPDTNRISVVTCTAPDGRAVVEFVDAGRGIPPSALQHIFDPFFTTRAAQGGTGLGLAICHGMVQAWGGEIQVESQEGHGSTFRLRLAPHNDGS